jgi:hypothetical protein
MGEQKYYSTISSGHQMEGSGQLCAPAALPPEATAPGTHCWVGPQSQTGLCGKKSLALPGVEPRFLGRPPRSLVAIPTELSRLYFLLHYQTKIICVASGFYTRLLRSLRVFQRFDETCSYRLQVNGSCKVCKAAKIPQIVINPEDGSCKVCRNVDKPSTFDAV